MSNAHHHCHRSKSQKKNEEMTKEMNPASKKTTDAAKMIIEVIQDTMIVRTMAVPLVQLGTIIALVIVMKKNLAHVDYAETNQTLDIDMMTPTLEGETVMPTFKR